MLLWEDKVKLEIIPFLKRNRKLPFIPPWKLVTSLPEHQWSLSFRHQQYVLLLISFNSKSLSFPSLPMSPLPFLLQASRLSFYSYHYLSSNYFFKSNKLPGLNQWGLSFSHITYNTYNQTVKSFGCLTENLQISLICPCRVLEYIWLIAC